MQPKGGEENRLPSRASVNQGAYVLAVRLLRSHGKQFTLSYLLRNFTLTLAEAIKILEAAQKARYPHMMSTRKLLEEKDS